MDPGYSRACWNSCVMLLDIKKHSMIYFLSRCFIAGISLIFFFFFLWQICGKVACRNILYLEKEKSLQIVRQIKQCSFLERQTHPNS